MKAKSSLAVTLLLAAMVLAGCNSSGSSSQEVSASSESSASESSVISESSADLSTEESVEESTSSVASEEAQPQMTRNEMIQGQIAEMQENEYSELSVTAEVLEGKAIVPGLSFNVHVTVTNNGDKTIVYQHGSGSAEVPDAVWVNIEGLQTVVPKGNLGPMTMDMQYKELAPGESETFVFTVMAIVPDSEFDSYTYELYSDGQKYIGDMGMDELKADYPNLTAADPGEYKGKAYLLYSVLADGGDAASTMTSPSTGYTQADITVTVTE